MLIWEAGIAAVEPLSQSRIFVDQEQDTKTAVALANPSDDPVTITLTLRDSTGTEVESTSKNFAPSQHQTLSVRPPTLHELSRFIRSRMMAAVKPQTISDS